MNKVKRNVDSVDKECKQGEKECGQYGQGMQTR